MLSTYPPVFNEIQWVENSREMPIPGRSTAAYRSLFFHQSTSEVPRCLAGLRFLLSSWRANFVRVTQILAARIIPDLGYSRWDVYRYL